MQRWCLRASASLRLVWLPSPGAWPGWLTASSRVGRGRPPGRERSGWHCCSAGCGPSRGKAAAAAAVRHRSAHEQLVGCAGGDGWNTCTVGPGDDARVGVADKVTTTQAAPYLFAHTHPTHSPAVWRRPGKGGLPRRPLQHSPFTCTLGSPVVSFCEHKPDCYLCSSQYYSPHTVFFGAANCMAAVFAPPDFHGSQGMQSSGLSFQCSVFSAHFPRITAQYHAAAAS